MPVKYPPAPPDHESGERFRLAVAAEVRRTVTAAVISETADVGDANAVALARSVLSDQAEPLSRKLAALDVMLERRSGLDHDARSWLDRVRDHLAGRVAFGGPVLGVNGVEYSAGPGGTITRRLPL